MNPPATTNTQALSLLPPKSLLLEEIEVPAESLEALSEWISDDLVQLEGRFESFVTRRSLKLNRK